MDEDLKPALDQLVDSLRGWLEAPSPTVRKIRNLEQEAAALAKELGGEAFRDIRKQLEQAETQAKRARQREAADAIAAACRELGVVLEPKDPLKRRRKKKAAAKTKPKATGGPDGTVGV